ncbi:MAG: xanthine dehydrogenase [Acidobacteria bacterium]|nr:MAG: xanthine dehydrogenase [Acidobacteriota bacterium]
MREALYRQLTDCLESRQLAALATVVEGPGTGNQLLIWPGGQTLGDLGAPRLNQRAAIYGEQVIPIFSSGRKTFQVDSETVDVFFEVLAPPPKLVVVGAVHVAIALVELARQLGFETIVIDPRGVFATEDRFDAADRLIKSWPDEALDEVGLDESTYLVLLSHDLKIDLPALRKSLRSSVRYVGALGSNKTHQKRVDALREDGFSDEELTRIHAPIGLDLGGRRAEEIALSIIAQIVAVQHGATG